MGESPASRGLPLPGRSADLDRLAGVFHALSDPTRLAIVGRLLSGEECVCNLTDALDTGQSRLSFHMKCLKDAGLVVDRRDGRFLYYRLEPGALRELVGLCALLCEKAESVAASCCGVKR